jgi:hypothetical protein
MGGKDATRRSGEWRVESGEWEWEWEWEWCFVPGNHLRNGNFNGWIDRGRSR